VLQAAEKLGGVWVCKPKYADKWKLAKEVPDALKPLLPGSAKKKGEGVWRGRPQPAACNGGAAPLRVWHRARSGSGGGGGRSGGSVGARCLL
jgi:hypothetical protein